MAESLVLYERKGPVALVIKKTGLAKNPEALAGSIHGEIPFVFSVC
jgi:hypothetical protein